jgi:hypothetical protein
MMNEPFGDEVAALAEPKRGGGAAEKAKDKIRSSIPRRGLAKRAG